MVTMGRFGFSSSVKMDVALADEPKKFVKVSVIVYVDGVKRDRARVIGEVISMPRLFRAYSTFGTATIPKASARDTVQTTDDQARPPEPVDSEGSIVTLSHEEMIEGVESRTVGTRGVSGADMATD